MCLPGRFAIFTMQSFGYLRTTCVLSVVRKISNQRPSAITKSIGNQMRHLSMSQNYNQPNTNLVASQIKKRPIRKKRIDDQNNKGYNVTAYATAEEYDLERLYSNIVKQDLYQRKEVTADELTDCLYVSAKYVIDDEPREIFFFREGSVVLWNCPELECGNVLKQLAPFEIDGYDRNLVQEESDSMSFNYDNARGHMKKGIFYLSMSDNALLEKYTFSNAISTSVKLGIWEALLDRYVDSMAYVTEDLKKGRKITMSRAEVLRKTGELFALRHSINLSSDLLDAPDFYWDRDDLEQLYSFICGYFSVQRRTKYSVDRHLCQTLSTNESEEFEKGLEKYLTNHKASVSNTGTLPPLSSMVLFECLHLFDRYSV